MRRVLLILLALAALGYGLTGIVLVRPGERGVVRRFGRILADKPEPGLWVGFPWGIDQVTLVPVDRVQNVVVGYQQEDDATQPLPPGQMLTGDHNLVNVQATVYYKVRADQLEDYVVQAAQVDGLVARMAETVIAEWTAGRHVDDVLLNGKNEMRPELLARTRALLEPYRLGVQILDARVSLIAPLEDVKVAFDQVARAQTTIATLVNKAEQEAQGSWRNALAEKYKLEQTIAGNIHGQLLLAHQEADNFTRRLRQYQLGRVSNPAYLRQIWDEERGRLLARLKENGQIGLLDHHLGPNGLDLNMAPPVPRPR